MKVQTDGYSFTFPDALEAYVFDETDTSKPTFHGAPMKAVDIMVELSSAYIYVEIKDYDDISIYDVTYTGDDEVERKKRQDGFRWLKGYLKYKCRDTYLYRVAEFKADKPIHYICVVNFDNALNNLIKKELRKDLPVGKHCHRWHQAIVESCQVVNVDKWNANFPNWPLARV